MEVFVSLWSYLSPAPPPPLPSAETATMAPPPPLYHMYFYSRGRILGRNWGKSLKSFPPCYSQSPLLTDFTPPPHPAPHLSKSGLKLVFNVKIV